MAVTINSDDLAYIKSQLVSEGKDITSAAATTIQSGSVNLVCYDENDGSLKKLPMSELTSIKSSVTSQGSSITDMQSGKADLSGGALASAQIPYEQLDQNYGVKVEQGQTPIVVTGKLLYVDGASTVGNIAAPNPSSLASSFEVWFFPVQAGQVWHITNTHPSNQSTGAAVFGVYGSASETLSTTDCSHENAILVSGRLATAVNTDNTISISYNPGSLVVTTPLTMPENAQWLVLTKYKPSSNPDVITVTKDVYISPTTAYENLQASKADLDNGVLKDDEIPYTTLDNRYMVSVGVGQTASNVMQGKSIGYYNGDSSAGNITDVASIGDRFELWFFPINAGEVWRIENTHPSGASLGSAAYAIYGGSTTIAYTECARSNALWVSQKLASALDTNVDLKAPSGSLGYNPNNLTLTPPLTMPHGAQWLVLTNYKYGSTKDVITVTKMENITTTEGVNALPMKVKRDGENVLVAYNKGGTELLYTFGRCFNTGDTINNTLGLAEVGYRKVDRPFPMAVGTATMLCHQHYSDMIGPVEIIDNGTYYWCGGAHQIDGEPTASTVNDAWYSIKADGNAVADGDDLYCHSVELVVVNKIQCPDNGTLTDCLEETITMTVVEDRVIVHVKHDYKYSGGVGKTLFLYYGMQSMFGARATTKVMTPDGKFPRLTAESSASSFTKGEYPNFNRFIQKNPDGWCQSAWVDPSVGIGDHSLILDRINIFQDGGANKFYHRLIYSQTITEGMTYEWEGIYRWEKDNGISIADDLAEHIESVTLVNVTSTGDVTQALDSNKFYKFGSVE